VRKMSDLKKVGWIIWRWKNLLSFPVSIYSIYIEVKPLPGKYRAKIVKSKGQASLIIDPGIKPEELDFQIGRAMIFWLIKKVYATKWKELKGWLLIRFPLLAEGEGNSNKMDKIEKENKGVLDALSVAIYDTYRPFLPG